MRAAPLRAHTRASPLTAPWEPIFARETDGALILGLFIGEAHCNSRGFAHGGLIGALADNAMGLSCGRRLGGGARLVTVSLSVDFLASARIGQWLEFDTVFVKPGGTLCFPNLRHRRPALRPGRAWPQTEGAAA